MPCWLVGIIARRECAMGLIWLRDPVCGPGLVARLRRQEVAHEHE